MLYRGPYSTAFYRQLHTVLHQEFRARRALDSLTRRRERSSSLRQDLQPVPALLWNGARLPFSRFRLDRIGRRDDRRRVNAVSPGLAGALEPTSRDGHGAGV